MSAHPDIDMQRIRHLLDRLDPTPRHPCTVEGCTHHIPQARRGKPGTQVRTEVPRAVRAHAKAA